MGMLYPDRMGRVFVLNPPWTVNVIWAFLSPFLTPELKAKYVIMSNKEDLKKYIDKDVLISEWGGDNVLDWAAYHKEQIEYDNKRLGEQ